MTRFSQLLNHFPKNAFKKIIANEKADRYLKSFKTWDLLHILLYGQITQTKSLRRVISGFNTHTNS
ncbi:MAG: DUF4372 domain-containing protein, partial [Xanthomonadales bacterium]|nr:DUF4372 domain-containing protein [Xanthomonadales bacterium]